MNKCRIGIIDRQMTVMMMMMMIVGEDDRGL